MASFLIDPLTAEDCDAALFASDGNGDGVIRLGEYITFLEILAEPRTFPRPFILLPQGLQDNYAALVVDQEAIPIGDDFTRQVLCDQTVDALNVYLVAEFGPTSSGGGVVPEPPSAAPVITITMAPTTEPTGSPSSAPIFVPDVETPPPTMLPTVVPTSAPSASSEPTPEDTFPPSSSLVPSVAPSFGLSDYPSVEPSADEGNGGPLVGVNGEFTGEVFFMISNNQDLTAEALISGKRRNELGAAFDQLVRRVVTEHQANLVNRRSRRRRRYLTTTVAGTTTATATSSSGTRHASLEGRTTTTTNTAKTRTTRSRITQLQEVTDGSMGEHIGVRRLAVSVVETDILSITENACKAGVPMDYECQIVKADFDMMAEQEQNVPDVKEFYTDLVYQAIRQGDLQMELDNVDQFSPITIEEGTVGDRAIPDGADGSPPPDQIPPFTSDSNNRDWLTYLIIAIVVAGLMVATYFFLRFFDHLTTKTTEKVGTFDERKSSSSRKKTKGDSTGRSGRFSRKKSGSSSKHFQDDNAGNNMETVGSRTTKAPAHSSPESLYGSAYSDPGSSLYVRER